MSKLYIVSGKICSGKSYYSKKLKEKINAVILSPDDATFKLINNEQGEFYNIFSSRLLDYMNELAVEIVKSGANVIYERGLWTRKDRKDIRQYFKDNGIDVEIHYIHISDEVWKKQIEERNKRVLEGNGGSDFYLDDGLMNKLLSKFEEPTKGEVDVWYENKYYNIRLAKLSDCKELSYVKRAVWETTYRGIYPDEKLDNYDYNEHEKKFEKIVSNQNVQLFVVEYEGKIIGYMSCGKPIRQFKNFEQEIGLLYLLKECQGTGLGKKLFNMAYEIIKENGYTEFFISCNKYNIPAQKFYKKMGGEIIHVDEDNEDKSIPQVKFYYNILN